MRVLYEENRGVISDEVENALFGIEFGGEAADITHRVGRTRAALYGRETHKHRCDFVRIGKEICFGDLLQALVGLEIAVRRGAASVDDTLRDTLMVEMGDFFAQDEIFQQRRAARSGAQGVLIIGNANALVRGQRMAFTALAVRIERFQLFVFRFRGFHAARGGRLFTRCGRTR